MEAGEVLRQSLEFVTVTSEDEGCPGDDHATADEGERSLDCFAFTLFISQTITISASICTSSTSLFKSVHELAKHLGKERAVVSHTLQLAQLSPEIIHLALIGALPEHITLKSLKTGLPADWEEQKKFLRIE